MRTDGEDFPLPCFHRRPDSTSSPLLSLRNRRVSSGRVAKSFVSTPPPPLQPLQLQPQQQQHPSLVPYRRPLRPRPRRVRAPTPFSHIIVNRNSAAANAAANAVNGAENGPNNCTASAEEPQRTVEVGDFRVRIGHLLGQGGYSSVYEVCEQFSQQKLALKVVDIGSDSVQHIKHNLLEEVRLLKDLVNVDHVVQLVASEVTPTQILMLMEQGTSDLGQILYDARDNTRPLDVQFVRYWGGEMFRAVAAVHKHNIVHSDLKPANFLVVRGGLKLIDFGIANRVPENGTSVQREVRIGTCPYMAPETHKEHQLRASIRPIQPRSRRASSWLSSTPPESKKSSSGSGSGSGWLQQQLRAASRMHSPDNSELLSSDQQQQQQQQQQQHNESGQCDDRSMTFFKVTKASDVWSCGIILYEMVYRRNPVAGFLDRNHPDDLANCSIGHPKTDEDGAVVPFALHEVIRDCLRIRPEERISADRALQSLFFAPVGVDAKAIASILKSAYQWGYEMCDKQRHAPPEKFEAKAAAVFGRLLAITNGEPVPEMP